MQIVIDLPEKTIAHIRSEYGHGKGFYPLNEEDKKIVNDAIYFGTPLPKNHGDLVDRNSLDFTDIDFYDPHCVYDVQNVVDNAPTVIEGSESE